MPRYIFLIEVIHRNGKWDIQDHYSTGNHTVVATFQFKWQAARAARRHGKRIVAVQGKNLRLELHIKNRTGRIAIKESYGVDPRTVRG